LAKACSDAGGAQSLDKLCEKGNFKGNAILGKKSDWNEKKSAKHGLREYENRGRKGKILPERVSRIGAVSPNQMLFKKGTFPHTMHIGLRSALSPPELLELVRERGDRDVKGGSAEKQVLVRCIGSVVKNILLLQEKEASKRGASSKAGVNIT